MHPQHGEPSAIIAELEMLLTKTSWAENSEVWIAECLRLTQVLSSDIDLLHPPLELEKQKHKLKRLVQSPNSFFMDVKCAGCFQM